MSPKTTADTALQLIARWARAAETDWTNVPSPTGQPAFGTYGTGYDGWGVQTQQKYAATMAALATLGNRIQFPDTTWALDRALASLRYNLASHKSGPFHCTDNSKWGHTWISALGVERMMYGVQLLQPHFTDADHAALRAMLCSEADWLLTDYHRGPEKRITATRWAHEGGNDPESNIWNGALLWRASVMYPDHPRAADWQERAHMFLINGVSIAADATDDRIVAGKPIRDRHIGPCFFPNYALDHHTYLNVGYMTICVSNAAMLHLDLKAAGLPSPESLHHHQADLWAVLRQMIFDDGRLARIGGDTRVRYAYCQEYLMPALLYAADHLGDPVALEKLPPQLARITHEAKADPTDNGYFYGARLAELRRQSPLYYTRLESDRSCALGMVATYAAQVRNAECGMQSEKPSEPVPHLEITTSRNPQSELRTWAEPEHGAALHRSPTRFASFSWRAFNLAQGLCLPPDDGHLAEWEHNLGGLVEFCHHPHPTHGQWKLHRRVNRYHVDAIDGGFVTCGSIYEGVDLNLAESWSGTDSALHQIAFAALPDNHTVVAMHHCRMGSRRGYVATIKGLHLNIPNDIFNDYRRQLSSASGDLTLTTPAPREELIPLASRWANIAGRIGAVGIYGSDTNSLSIHRASHRRSGAMRSLHVEHLCWPCEIGPKKFEAGEVILDAGWAALASVDAAKTAAFAQTHDATKNHIRIDDGMTIIRALRVTGQDGRAWILAANFGQQPATLTATQLGLASSAADISLEPGHARLLPVGTA